jgi:peptidyl-prolyl cis-trans isomerase A (cyclophilin A)
VTSFLIRVAIVLPVSLGIWRPLSAAAQEGRSVSDNLPLVELVTPLGSIVLEIDTVYAPITASNFLRYVDEDRYLDAHFYRVVTLRNQPRDSVRIEVIQGGLGFRGSEHELPPIQHESTRQTGLRHLDGTVSMARLEPGTASSEIFISVGDQPELDFGGRRNPDGQGFAAFGRVREGMNVVRRIQQLPESAQLLESPVTMTRVRRVPSSADTAKTRGHR